MPGRLIMEDHPQLLAPYIIVGMNGWLNGGGLSTGSIDYLRRKLDAPKFAHIDSQGFYIYQIPSGTPEQTLRPHTLIREGQIMKLDIPENDFFFWKSNSEHDLILFLGTEPNLGWPEYSQHILDVARQFQVLRIYILGGILDSTPHTRKTRIHATVSHPRLKDEFKTFADFGDYEGPCSFGTMLLAMASEQGIEAAGISARTPLYIHDLNSKACYQLLKNVLATTGLQIDLNDLWQAGKALMEIVDKAFIENPEALAQLKKMEEVVDAAMGEEPLRGQDEDYDQLLEEVRRMKREGRKPH